MIPAETRRAFEAKVEEARLGRAGEEAVERALAGGADQAEAYAQFGQSIAVRFEKGDMKLTQVDEGTSLGLRVFRDRRQGFSSTNQASEASLAGMAADALTLAGFSVPDEANVLAGPRPIDPDLGLVRASLVEGFGVEQVVEAGQELVRRTLARDRRLSIDQASLSLDRVSVAVRSSTGIAASESDAQVSLSLFGMAIDGDDVSGFDYWGEQVRERNAIEGAIERVSIRFADAVLGNLAAGAARSYRGPVLLSPSAFQDIFLSPLLSAASSIAVQRGRSALAGKVGQRVAHPALSIVDDPSDVRLAGASTFDREGQPARRYPLVEEGVLAGLLYNTYSANVDGTRSTGHATGGARAVPGLGCSAVQVAPGKGGTPEELRRRLGTGLLVQRFSGTVDPASGDFSGVAKSARWIEGGEIVRSVRETLLSGNAFALLRSLDALSSASESVMGSALVPWALIDGISVTGG